MVVSSCLIGEALCQHPISTTKPTASTSSRWNCDGGACGCGYFPKNSTEMALCHSMAPFGFTEFKFSHEVTMYGSVATSLGACGTCWKLDLPKSDQRRYDWSLILRNVDSCRGKECEGRHFELLAPALGKGCGEREPEEEGWKSCVGGKCDCREFQSKSLRNGCTLMGEMSWDNPNVTYGKVPCPFELANMTCNGSTVNSLLLKNDPDSCRAESAAFRRTCCFWVLAFILPCISLAFYLF